MGLYTQQVQQLYVAYFNRPADVAGLNYWESVVTANGGDTSAVSAAFATTPEYATAYAGLGSAAIVNQVYLNLFGRPAEPAGLLYWALLIDQRAISISNVVTVIAAGAQGSDADAYNNKVSAATLFTDSLDTTEQILAYDGAAANAVAKQFIASVTDAASFADAVSSARFQETLDHVIEAHNSTANTPTTISLTNSLDAIAPSATVALKGNDTINALLNKSGSALTAFDSVDAGQGTDTLNVVAIDVDFALAGNVTVKNVELANVTGNQDVTIDTAGWTGLKTLNVSAGGTISATAASDVAIQVTGTSTTSADVTVNGGSTVSVASSSSTAGGNIKVGGTTAATGAVTVSSAYTLGAGSAAAINVTGGTGIGITQIASKGATNGVVTVNGTAATTTVTVNNSATATTAAVAIVDVNGGTTSAGKITSATVNNFNGLSISDNALTSLTVSGGAGNIIIDNTNLATPTNKTLALSINNQNKGTLDDADIYTTLNVTTTGADSILSNVTFGAATALNVAGTKSLELESTAGLTKLQAVTVTGSAGIKGDFSGASVTSVTTTGTTGTATVTINAANATYTGGAGSDNVTASGTTSTKAISLGAGDDSLNLGSVTSAPTAAIDGGAGTDTLTLTAALAQTSSADAKFAGIVKGFEGLVLTSAGSETVKLDVLGSFSAVSTAGATNLTLANLPSGGTLTLTGKGTAYTIDNTAFTATSATTDVLNVALKGDSSKAGIDFATTGITAAGVETINISVTNTAAKPDGSLSDTLTVLGNSAKAINVSGNEGLTLTANANDALTSLDASGISLGGFNFVTTAALANAATIKGSATGTNVITANSAKAAVTYTGGTGTDTITINNGKNNVISLGEGNNSFTGTGAGGNNTVTSGTGNDTIVLGSGNNNVDVGNGTNSVTVTSGNNTIKGGTGVDTVTVGGGQNNITTGTGADLVVFSAKAANVNSYSTITDAHKGLTIALATDTIVTGLDLGTETFKAAKVELQNTAVFQDYANAVIQQNGNASANGAFGWFVFNGDTYLVQSRHDGSAVNASFINGTDFIVKLTGVLDLSTATVVATAGFNAITLG